MTNIVLVRKPSTSVTFLKNMVKPAWAINHHHKLRIPNNSCGSQELGVPFYFFLFGAKENP